MSEPTYTKEQLRNSARDGWNLAIFALAQMERAESAEAERDRLSAQLDSILANSDSLESGKLADAHAEIARLREENKSLHEANEIDLGEKAPLIFENAKLKARNEILREELKEAEEAIRQADNRTADPGDLLREGYSIDFCKRVGVWLQSPAVRRARERKEQEE